MNADFLDVQRAEVEAARFYCVTSNHDRVLHFMSNNSKVLNAGRARAIVGRGSSSRRSRARAAGKNGKEPALRARRVVPVLAVERVRERME